MPVESTSQVIFGRNITKHTYLSTCFQQSFFITVTHYLYISSTSKNKTFTINHVFLCVAILFLSVITYSSACWKVTRWSKHNFVFFLSLFYSCHVCNKKLWIQTSMDDATAKMVNSGHFTLANLRESRLYHLSPFTQREFYKCDRDGLLAIFEIFPCV